VTAQQIAEQQLKRGPALNETSARLVAEREGISYVLTGSIAPRGSGYTLTVKALDPASGAERAVASQVASDKGQVLKGIDSVASKLRDQLGDETPESVRRADGETVTAASLDALQSYSIAQDLSSGGRQQESIPHYQKAIDLDANFGRAYSGLATVLFNLGRRDEAAELWKKSLALIDRMTEREKYRTLGLWFAGPGANYEQAIENFEKLLARYPADRAGQNNLGFVYFQMLDFQKAMEHGREAVELFPKNPRLRQNYALYAMYAGDFKTADEEARHVLEQAKGQYKAYLPLAAVAFAAGDRTAMRGVYENMRSSGSAGASTAAHGLADLAMYEGRWTEAETLLEAGVAADEQSKDNLARAAKLTALAEVQLALNRVPDAVRTAAAALAITREDPTLVSAAFVFIRGKRFAEARAIAEELGKALQPRRRAYSAIIEGELARAAGRPAEARDAFLGARKLADLWLGRYLFGVTYVEANDPRSALAELEVAEKRKGEAIAVFLNDVPSFRYLAPLPYWLARAQEGLDKASPAAAENYEKFLALRSDESRDPLVLDARKRLAALSSR
jgi:tetratricopeptide (TPR) repeat protein